MNKAVSRQVHWVAPVRQCDCAAQTADCQGGDNVADDGHVDDNHGDSDHGDGVREAVSFVCSIDQKIIAKITDHEFTLVLLRLKFVL